MIYFDNAATSYPKPPEVLSAIYDTVALYGGNPGRSGHKMSIKVANIVYNMRESIVKFFNFTDPERVILTKNCTEALNLAIFSVMKNGGNAIISSFEHNSVVRPLEYLKSQKICDYKVAKCSFESPVHAKYAFEALVDEGTKMIICTHASNVTGKLAPIKEISDICRRKNLIFCLDASQTAGIIPINMQKDGINILCCAGHKSLFGPTGTGLLIADKNVAVSPIIYGGTGSVSGSFDMPDFMPDVAESGTLNVVGAAGLNAGISFINKKGIENIHSYETSLSQRFYNNLVILPQIIFYSSYPKADKSVSTLSFGVKGKASTEVADVLNSKNIAVRSGLHCAPLAHDFLGTRNNGTVRVSFSPFNTIQQIDYACKIVRDIK